MPGLEEKGLERTARAEQFDPTVPGSAERWKNMGKLRKYGGAVVALAKSVGGNEVPQNQMDADRQAAFMQDLRDRVAQESRPSADLQVGEAPQQPVQPPDKHE